MLLGSPSALKKPGRKTFGEMSMDCLGDMYITYNLFNNSSSRLSLALSLLLGNNFQFFNFQFSIFKTIVCRTTEADLTGTQCSTLFLLSLPVKSNCVGRGSQ